MLRHNQPKKIDSIVGNVLSQRGYLKICKEYDVITQWESIVGEKIADVTECSKVENGVLYVRVKNSSWRNELVYLKATIIKNIIIHTDCSSIKDIVFY